MDTIGDSENGLESGETRGERVSSPDDASSDHAYVFTCVEIPCAVGYDRWELLTIDGEQALGCLSAAWLRDKNGFIRGQVDKRWFAVLLPDSMLAGLGDWVPMEASDGGDSWGELEIVEDSQAHVSYETIAAIGVHNARNPIIGLKRTDGSVYSFPVDDHGNDLLGLARRLARIAGTPTGDALGIGRLDMDDGTVSFDGRWCSEPDRSDYMSACTAVARSKPGVDPAREPVWWEAM